MIYKQNYSLMNRPSRCVLPLLFSALVIHPVFAANTTVNIKNHAFNPAEISIGKGNTVVWINKDSDQHTVVSNDNLFTSDPLSQGKQFSYTFKNAGTYSYYCSIHPDMVGKIIVK